MRVSFEMAKKAEVEASAARNVKGHQTSERQKWMTPPKIVHLVMETLDEIRGKSKPGWKSNLVDMNLDNYYDDAPTELFDDPYLRGYESELGNWIQQEDQMERIYLRDQ
uniref:Uncharacterized protein n=1 Tax=Romanomermis culicivorax TaxID=13658 RepID=A0A915JP34_ROMCU